MKENSTEEKYNKLFHHANDGIVVFDLNGRILDANQKALELLEYPVQEFIGMQIEDLQPSGVPPLWKEVLNRISAETKTGFESKIKKKSGTVFEIDVSSSLFELSGQQIIQAIIRDITDRKKAEEEIRFLAYYDSLTKLPNRTFYKELLSRALFRAQRHKEIVATLYIDLDHFKRVNDTLGHSIGDELLRSVADLLVRCVRKTDLVARFDEVKITDAVSRMGGDEFVVLLCKLNNAQDAVRVARRIMDDIAHPFTLGDREVFISASIGISLYPFDGQDVETLLKNADIAMYNAKDQGRNNFQFYSDSMNVDAAKKFTIGSDLHRTLEREEFRLYYQAKLNIKSHKIIGSEALIRWRHPEMGWVSLEDFIPIAEETGLIVPIGNWVIRNACLQNRTWQKAGFKALTVSINLSNRQFKNEQLIETVSKAIKDSEIVPNCLELEITESTIMKDPGKTIELLTNLKKKGVKVALDDFGTGYSSLSHLRRFPLDTLKIDRSFIKNITTSQDDAVIVSAIIALGHSLRLNVIAEGVETAGQFQFLAEHGCDEVQGYLFSKPVPAEEFLSILQSQ